MRSARGKALAGAVVLFSAAGLGAAYLVFFTPESPAPVSLDAPGDQAPAAARIDETDPTGRWVIRDGSQAGYRVREKLARLPAPSDAVGRSDQVTGGFSVFGSGGRHTITNLEVEVDMTALTSDSPRRDDTLRKRGLETDRFPTAHFQTPGPIALPANLGAGRSLGFVVDGSLTIHGVTRLVSIPVEAQLDGETLKVVGSLTMHMADFGIEPPNVANIVSVEPTGTMEFSLLLEKAAEPPEPRSPGFVSSPP